MTAMPVAVRGEGEIADAVVRRLERSPRLALSGAEAARVPAGGLLYDTSDEELRAGAVGDGIRRIVVGWNLDGALPLVLPAFNLNDRLDRGGDLGVAPAPAQIAAPILAALEPLLEPCSAETVTTLASKSVGGGLRKELDGFLATTERSLREAGAPRAKAIAIFTPADPPPPMRLALSLIATRVRLDREQVRTVATSAVEDLHAYWPHCRLRREPAVRDRDTPWGRRPVVSLDLLVEPENGMPVEAGNVAVTAAAALIVGEAIARRRGRPSIPVGRPR